MDTFLQAASRQALAFAATYCALLSALCVILIFRVIRQRYRARTGLGDGGDPELARAIRVHGNFAETAPFLMALLILLPLLGAREWLVHLVGLAGLTGRIAHAIGLSQSAGKSPGRAIGMVLTLASMLTGAGALLILAWRPG